MDNLVVSDFSYGDYISLSLTLLCGLLLQILPIYIVFTFKNMLKDYESSDHAFLIDLKLRLKPKYSAIGYPIQFYARR